jgi:hypothetical protein
MATGDTDSDDSISRDEDIKDKVNSAGRKYGLLYSGWVDEEALNDLGYDRPQIDPLDYSQRFASQDSERLAETAKMWALLASDKTIQERLGVDPMIASSVRYCLHLGIVTDLWLSFAVLPMMRGANSSMLLVSISSSSSTSFRVASSTHTLNERFYSKI